MSEGKVNRNLSLWSKKIEKSIPKPKCAFPKCSEFAVTTYCGIPLCQKHAEWAEFIRWFYYKLGL